MPEAVKIDSINELGWGKGKTIVAGGGVIVSVCLLAWGVLIATGNVRFSIKGHEIILFPVKFKEHSWLVSRIAIALGGFGVGMGIIIGSVVAYNRWELKKALEAAKSDEFFWQEPEKGTSTHLTVRTRVYRISKDDVGYRVANISDHKDSLTQAKAVELRATSAVKNRATHVLKEKISAAQDLVMQGPEMIRVLEEEIRDAEATVIYASETEQEMQAELNKKAEKGEAVEQREIDRHTQRKQELEQAKTKLEQLRQEFQSTRGKIEAAQMEIGTLREEHSAIVEEIQTEKAKEAKARVDAAHRTIIAALVQKEQAEKNLRILQEKQRWISTELALALQDLRQSQDMQSLESKAEALRKQLEPLEQEIRQIEATILSLQDEALQVKTACAADNISAVKFHELNTRHVNLQLKVSTEEFKLLPIQRAAEKIRKELDTVNKQIEEIFVLFDQQKREKLEQLRQQVLQAEEALFEKEQAFETAKATLEKAQAVDPETIARKEAENLRIAAFARFQEKIRVAQDLIMQESTLISELEEEIEDAAARVLFARMEEQRTQEILNQKQEGMAPEQSEIDDHTKAAEELEQRNAELEQACQKLQATREKIEAAKAEIRAAYEQHHEIAAKIQEEKIQAAKARLEDAKAILGKAYASRDQSNQARSSAIQESKDIMQKLCTTRADSDKLQEQAKEIREYLAWVDQLRQKTKLAEQNEHQAEQNFENSKNVLRNYEQYDAVAMYERQLIKVTALEQNYHTLKEHTNTLQAALMEANQKAHALRQNLETLEQEIEKIQQSCMKLEAELAQNKERIEQAIRASHETDRAVEAAKTLLAKAEAIDPETIARKEAASLRKAIKLKATQAKAEEMVLQQEEAEANEAVQRAIQILEQAKEAKKLAEAEIVAIRKQVLETKNKLPVPVSKNPEQAAKSVLEQLKQAKAALVALNSIPGTAFDKQSAKVNRLQKEYDAFANQPKNLLLVEEAEQRVNQTRETSRQKAEEIVTAEKNVEKAQSLLSEKRMQLRLAHEKTVRAELDVQNLHQ